uniref:mannose-1-phosphate guanylyltransferase n=2 Tax=Enterobacteriaceae TaxID=543 RepID=B5L3K1_SHIDY|nr:ManC [Shigella dysenteriae]
MSLLPVIIAGGTGSRLWPLSRVKHPKQFLHLGDDGTMLQTTLNRLQGLKCDNPIVICNEQHRFIVAEQLRQLNKLTQNIILEPVGRNTAPAVTLAALNAIRNKSKQSKLILVLAADHIIKDEDAFCRSVLSAIPYANKGKLITFGIVPNSPETGYGYIKRGHLCSGNNANLAFEVAEFVEKPNIDTAQEFLSSGNYYWNSGMFLFRADRYLDELKKYRPDILEACKKSMIELNGDLDFIRINKDAFCACPDESIDYAVMEKTNDAVVIPMDAGWSDVGSWSSLWEMSNKTIEENVIVGDVVTYDSDSSYLRSGSGLLATVGVKDLVVVQTKDAVLVANRNSVQNVKKIVERLKSENRSEVFTHLEVYRPWGKYESIDNGERYEVKRISVKPGEGISLQMHHHRSEHWIIVSGTAKVTICDETRILSENESIYIPVGAKHCLENPGKIMLELIEVRSGSYLGEDDVIRFADRYGRT